MDETETIVIDSDSENEQDSFEVMEIEDIIPKDSYA